MDEMIRVPDMTWCFHHDALRKSLNDYRNQLVGDGMSPQDATQHTQQIADYLSGEAADKLILSVK